LEGRNATFPKPSTLDLLLLSPSSRAARYSDDYLLLGVPQQAARRSYQESVAVTAVLQPLPTHSMLVQRTLHALARASILAYQPHRSPESLGLVPPRWLAVQMPTLTRRSIWLRL